MHWMLLAVAVMLAVGSADAADLQSGGDAVYGKAPRHGRSVPPKEDSDVLFTLPEAFPRVYIPPHTPILLGSSTLPGFYGSNHSYDDQGPYYGGENINYRFRLPYACGVLGYC